MPDDLDAVIGSTPVVVHPGDYLYVRPSVLPDAREHLMVFGCGDDLTVVTPADDAQSLGEAPTEGPYRLIEFRIPTPFESPGFLARISGAIAACGMNVLLISSFSCDYALVKSVELDRALDALRGAGFSIGDQAG